MANFIHLFDLTEWHALKISNNTIMKILDRQVLRWLESIKNKANITDGSPADLLIEDLRYEGTSTYY